MLALDVLRTVTQDKVKGKIRVEATVCREKRL